MRNYIHGASDNEQKRLRKLNNMTNESFIDFLDIKNKDKICDFGCGMANMLIDINEKYPDTELTGIEISEEQYKTALKYCSNKKNIIIKKENVLNNNLPDNYFDITYCRYLLEHVNSPVDVVREMARITKPGGNILCQENDMYNVIFYPEIKGFSKLLNMFCNLQIKKGGDPYIGRKLYDIFKKAGCVNIELSYKPEIYTEENEDDYKLWLFNTYNIQNTVKNEIISNENAEPGFINSVINNIKYRAEHPEGICLFHWNRVKAVK
jgi:ubiquinone/menaquinone biosynthesis C-methylase UbiE